MKTANFNQKNTKYTPTRYFLSRHLGHLKPPRTFLTRHLFIDGHLLPSALYPIPQLNTPPPPPAPPPPPPHRSIL